MAVFRKEQGKGEVAAPQAHGPWEMILEIDRISVQDRDLFGLLAAFKSVKRRERYAIAASEF